MANKKKMPKVAGPKQRCGGCNGTGSIPCRRCLGKKTFTDWMHKTHTCTGCGGTGEQACIPCGQMGYRQ